MKKKIFIGLAAAIGFILIAYFLFFSSDKKASVVTFGKTTKGNLDIVITSSGTLEATSTVDVGTQVSGKIAKLYADFNSEVRKGQLLAVLDTTTLAAQVRDARANLIKAKSDYKQKLAIHQTNKKLYDKNFISELDYIKSESDAESSMAGLQSAETALERAKTNLDYAYIYAPIAGKIINRSIEEGQTVAASFSAPVLFTIAEDLSSMRILANVDESDIGQIKEGQKVSFTVQTYSDKKFEGTVTQIRLHSSTVSNVVNYTVVIKAPNSEKFLLPGMTATIDFYVDHRENVMLVPNTALRIEPDESMMKEIKKNFEEEMKSMQGKMPNGPRPAGPPPEMKGKDKNSMKTIYYVDDKGRTKMMPVMTGLTDGKNTEISGGRDIKEGMKIITGITEEEATTTTKSGNALTPTQQNGPPPPPMM
jgi:HlyD family secretion protein